MIVAPGLIRGTPRYTRGRQIFSQLNPTRYVEPGVLASPFTITRAQAAGVQSTSLGSDGTTWQTYGANTARFFDSAQALLIEPQTTNRIRNPRGEGGITSPPSWAVFANNGLTTSIAGRGTQDGREYVDLRLNGTSTGTFYVQVFDNIAAAVTAGQSSIGSVWVSVVGGSLNNITSFATQLRWSAGGTNSVFSTPTSTPTRLTHIGVAPTVATSVFYGYTLEFNSGVAIDVTFRFSWPQLETNRSFLLTPALPPVGALGASTRGVDNISAPLISLGLSNLAQGTGCTVLWAGGFFATNFDSQQTIVAIDDGVAQNRFELRIGRQAQPESLLVIDSAQYPAGGTGLVPPNKLIKAGMTITPTGELSVVYDGFNNNVPIIMSGGTTTNALTTLRLGGSGTGAARPLTGTTRALYVAPTALSATDLSAALMAMPV